MGELALPQGDGVVMANVGIKGSATKLGLECTNMELLPVGNGQSVFDGVRTFLADPLGVPPMAIPTMITFPSVKDRAYKRNGSEETARESCQLLVMAKTEWFGKIPEPEVGTTTIPAWKHPERSPDYAKVKAKWVERLQALLLTVYPQLKGKLDMFDISTPLSIEHYLPTVSGSAIGLDTNGGKGCRFTDFSIMKLLDMKTPVQNLWLTGQDALMIGVPLAQGAGLITAVRIGGPLRAVWFAFKSLWLLTASLGAKSRSKS
jgi:all-trans-retinol 13,14-reductase